MKPELQILCAAAWTSAFPALSPAGAADIQTTGTPGSPGATTTIPGTQLPAPQPKFGGVIKDNAIDSKQ